MAKGGEIVNQGWFRHIMCYSRALQLAYDFHLEPDYTFIFLAKMSIYHTTYHLEEVPSKLGYPLSGLIRVRRGRRRQGAGGEALNAARRCHGHCGEFVDDVLRGALVPEAGRAGGEAHCCSG